MSALLLLPAAAPTGSIDVQVTQLRSAKGVVRLCVTADPQRFPSCVGDDMAVKRVFPADRPSIRIDGLARGEYAVAVIHDENANRKLDKFAGIPREGFGFSRNPTIGFGPPSFDSAAFALGSDASTQQVKIRYLF